MGMPTGRGGLSLGTGARTLMIEAHRAFMLGETWALDGYASLGLTRISIDPLSLVTNASAIIGCRFGVQARRPAMGGVVSFGVAQPLKIERGAAHIMFASGYDLASRALIFDHAWASLAGERRLAVTASYRGSGMFRAFRAGTMRDFPDGGITALVGWSAHY